jgi:hypothetical protein
MKTCPHKNLHAMFIALFIIAQSGNNPNVLQGMNG